MPKPEHKSYVDEMGFCPWCDLRMGAECDDPCRLSGTDMFMVPSVAERNELRSLDAIHGGLPEWFPYERRREGRE